MKFKLFKPLEDHTYQSGNSVFKLEQNKIYDISVFPKNIRDKLNYIITKNIDMFETYDPETNEEIKESKNTKHLESKIDQLVDIISNLQIRVNQSPNVESQITKTKQKIKEEEPMFIPSINIEDSTLVSKDSSVIIDSNQDNDIDLDI